MVIPDDFVKQLRDHVIFKPVCPEFEIGLGIPRDPIRIVAHSGKRRLMQPATGRDVSTLMGEFADKHLSALGETDGFIFKGRSPSCGIKDVKIYSGLENAPVLKKGSGFFGGAVMEKFPDLAIEDEGRLENFRIREHFLTKLFSLASWRKISKQKSTANLVGFHSANKMLLMAYSQKELKIMGQIAANHEKKNIDDVFSDYGQHFKRALARAPRYVSNINVLMHAMGYFSRELKSAEKSYFLSALEKYRIGREPLSVPVSLLRSWIIRFDQEYLINQTFFEPFPEELIHITDSGKGRDE